MGAWWGCCDTVLMCLLVEGHLRVLLYKLPSWVKKTPHFSVEISHLRVGEKSVKILWYFPCVSGYEAFSDFQYDLFFVSHGVIYL